MRYEQMNNQTSKYLELTTCFISLELSGPGSYDYQKKDLCKNISFFFFKQRIRDSTAFLRDCQLQFIKKVNII